MSDMLHREKLLQAYDLMRELNIDAWLIPTSDASDPCLPLIPGDATVGNGAFLFAKQGRAWAFCSSIDAQDIEASGLFDTVVKYAATPDADLRGVLETLRPATLALNYSRDDHLCDGLTVGRFRHLKKVLDGLTLEFASSEPLLRRLRSIKSGLEIERLSEAIRLTEAIYAEAAGRMRPGMSEKDIGALFVDGMAARHVVNGLDGTLAMPMVLKTNIAHRPPGDYVVEPGDLVIVDFSVAYQGYCSDIARTFYFLKPGETEAPPAYRAAFAAVFDAISAAAAVMRPGVTGADVDAAARHLLIERGYPPISHATGHQIGQFTHDGGAILGPAWQRYGNTPHIPLEAGMVFTLEPTILPPEPPYILSEENVLVTADGVRFLSERQASLILIPDREEKS